MRRRAPSSRNWQPWDFVVVTDRGQLEDLSKVWRGAGHVAKSAATIADQQHARRVLGLPEDREAAYLIDFGYPADRPLRPLRKPNRRPLQEVVHRGGW